MCGHQCDCFCHRYRYGNSPCVRCTCNECCVCGDYIFLGSLQDHINLCHNMAQAHIHVSRRRPSLGDLVAVAV